MSSFRTSNKDKNVPLIEDNTNELMSSLQNKFLEFTRSFDQIKDYCKSLTYLGQREYNKKKNEIQSKIIELPSQFIELNSIILLITNMEIRDSVLNRKLRDQLKQINERFISKQSEIPKILNDILEKEKQVNKRMGLNESDLDVSFISTSQNHNFKPNFDKIRESKIVLDEVMDNVEYLLKRQEQFEEIKKVASQVKEISCEMTLDVAKTGDDLNRLENIVVDASQNTFKAENEIKRAEKETRSLTRKILYLLAIICFLILCIVMLVVFIWK